MLNDVAPAGAVQLRLTASLPADARTSVGVRSGGAAEEQVQEQAQPVPPYDAARWGGALQPAHVDGGGGGGGGTGDDGD